jgi:hypothetical protein
MTVLGIFALAGNHENSKHQIPNSKQIPMTQIQKSKHVSHCANGIFRPPDFMSRRAAI